MIDEQRLNEFIRKSSEGSLSEEERGLFLEWLRTAPADRVHAALDRYGRLLEEHGGEEGTEHPQLMHGIEDRLDELEHRPGRRPWRRWAVRAASDRKSVV